LAILKDLNLIVVHNIGWWSRKFHVAFHKCKDCKITTPPNSIKPAFYKIHLPCQSIYTPNL